MCLLIVKEKPPLGTLPEVQWLRFCASNVWDSGLIPGRRNKIPHAWQGGQRRKTTLSPSRWQLTAVTLTGLELKGHRGDILGLNWFSSGCSYTLLSVHHLLITLLAVCLNPAFCLLWIFKFYFHTTRTKMRRKDCANVSSSFFFHWGSAWVPSWFLMTSPGYPNSKAS